MNAYLLLKTVHVLSSTLLFGTGLGTAFFMFMANRSGDRRAMAVVGRNVVRADLFFTTPAVVVQPLSGLAMMHLAGHPMCLAPMNWLGLSLLLYLLAGACWLPVLWLQWRMHRLAAAAPDDPRLPPAYARMATAWTALGVPAFTALVLVFWLMVAKPF
jgi:uncharacterized membrane protein